MRILPFPSMADEYETTRDLASRIYEIYGHDRHGRPASAGEILDAAYEVEPALLGEVWFSPGGEVWVRECIRRLMLG